MIAFSKYSAIINLFSYYKIVNITIIRKITGVFGKSKSRTESKENRNVFSREEDNDVYPAAFET